MPPEEWPDLADEAWDSAASIHESVPLTAPQREELDRRLEAYRNDPTAGDPWEIVKARILGGK